MIGKNEESHDENTNISQKISSKRKILEDDYTQVHQEIRNCFSQISKALQLREKQLLRQAEAIYNQQISLVQSNLESLPTLTVNLDVISDLEKQIQCFGKIELSGANCLTLKDFEPYKVAYYQEVNEDHISFNKSIEFQKNKNSDIKEIDDQRLIEIDINNENDNVSYSNNSSFNSSSINDSYTEKESSVIINSINNGLENSLNSETLPLCSQANVKVISKELNSIASRNTLNCIKNTTLNISEDIDTKCSNGLQFNTFENSDIDSPSKTVPQEEKTETEKITNVSNGESYKVNQDHNYQKVISSPTSDKKNQEVLLDTYEHPKQVQQWLQQILVEPETEPMIHEAGQFSEISATQFYNNFPLET